MGVNSLPKTVTRQRRDYDLNPGPYAPESSTLTTRLPSHPEASNVSRYLSILCPCTQAGDVRDGKPGPNTRVKMFVHDVQTNTRVPLEPAPQYTDVYATCLAQAARGHLLPKPKSCGPLLGPHLTASRYDMRFRFYG